MVATRDDVQKQLGPLSAIIEREKQAVVRKGKVAELKLADLSPLRILGIGTFGVVKLVQHKDSKKVYALKQVRPNPISPHQAHARCHPPTQTHPSPTQASTMHPPMHHPPSWQCPTHPAT